MFTEFILIIFMTASAPQMPDMHYVVIADDDGSPATWTSQQTCRAFVATTFHPVIQGMRDASPKNVTITPVCVPVSQEVI